MLVKKVVVNGVKFRIKETERFLEYTKNGDLIVGVKKEEGLVVSELHKDSLILGGKKLTLEKIKELPLPIVRALMIQDIKDVEKSSEGYEPITIPEDVLVNILLESAKLRIGQCKAFALGGTRKVSIIITREQHKEWQKKDYCITLKYDYNGEWDYNYDYSNLETLREKAKDLVANL